MELPHRDSQIGFVELVGDVPANGAKLTALLDEGVEETQAIQHLLPGVLTKKMGGKRKC